MKKPFLALLGAAPLALYGCAHAPPPELQNARAAYEQASAGPAAQVDPADLYNARKALDQANASFNENGANDETRDLAYVAQRKAQFAEAQAHSIQAGQVVAQSQQQERDLAAQKAAQAKQELSATQRQLEQARTEQQQREAQLAEQQRLQAEQQAQAQAQLQAQQAEQQRQLQQTQQQLEDEKRARAEAEANAKATAEKLEEVAKVKEEQRGLVITLNGAVLFPTGQASLLPTAMERLDQVADALKQGKANQRIVVEGYTDSRGNDVFNQQLSQLRAQSVRDYLVSRGVTAEQIAAVGLGKSRPVADNATAEGRANNRRVEIVVQKQEGQNPRG